MCLRCEGKPRIESKLLYCRLFVPRRGYLAMDVVMIPLVRPQEQVSSALDLLYRRERSGLLVQSPSDTYRLFHAGDLLRGRAADISVVERVTGGYEVLVVELSVAQSFGVDLIRPFRTPRQCEGMLDRYRARYALVGEAYDTAMIMTRHEGQAAALTMTGGYECSGLPTHRFPEPRVSVGDRCPENPHSSGPDGGVPTIRPAWRP
jgi:hypothetical protein